MKKAVGAGAAGPREIGEPHVGVTCNSCDKDIHGFRYKCITCPEYDLCGKCEAKVQLHSKNKKQRHIAFKIRIHRHP